MIGVLLGLWPFWQAGGGPATPAPFEWKTAAPESQGMSAAGIDAAVRGLPATKTRAFLVVRNDRIVCEWYAPGRSASDRQGTASLAKAIVGGMSLAVAINDGLISIDDKASKYVPRWAADPVRSRITVRHLGSHTSGIKDSLNEREQAQGIDQNDYTGWEGEFWRWRSRKPAQPEDAFTLSRDVPPVVFAPGSELRYSNPGIAMLTYCVTASLRGARHTDIRTLLRERVMRPIGTPDKEWECGYRKTEVVDGLPLVASWGGGSYTPRAAARIGRLVLREGDWDGTRLLSADSIRQVTHDAGLPGHCGMGWWTNAGERYPWLPQDAVWGSGAGDQILLVVPSLKLIVVRNGETVPGGKALETLARPLIAAITGDDREPRIRRQ